MGGFLVPNFPLRCRDVAFILPILAADSIDDETVERRRKVREQCFTYPPGGASERVVEAIQHLVE